MRLDAGGDALTCDYCGNIYFPDKNDDGVRVLGEATGEPCPVCAIPLMQASLAGAPIGYCTRCRGMLIPMDRFEALVEELRQGQKSGMLPPPADPSELQRRLTCPHCHQPMETHFYAGPGNVVLSDCERCSLIWLDHGKLQRIAHAPDVMDEDRYSTEEAG
jgi:Zn-finger nucleic acid-binding protein